jgi:hypothetical protein
MQKLLVVIFTLSFFSGSGQFLKQWEAIHNQAGYSAEKSKEVLVDQNGDYFVLARTCYDVVILKYSTTGLLWKYQTGNGTPVPSDSEPLDMALDHEGNTLVLVAVPDCPFGAGCSVKNAMIFKLGTSGELIWNQFLDSGTPGALSNWKVLPDSNNNVFCIFEKDDNFQTVKFNPSGEEQWRRSFDRSGKVDVVTGASVVSTDDIIVYGYSATSGTALEKEPVLISYNEEGNEAINASTAFADISVAAGAYPFQVVEDENVLYVGLRKYGAIYKFDLVTGTSSGRISLMFYPAPDFFAVGNDGFLYLADAATEDLRFRKFSKGGEHIWTLSYNSSNGSTPYIDDFYFVEGLFDRNENKMYVLANRRRFADGVVTWGNQIYEVSADKSLRTVAPLTNEQKNFNANAFVFDGTSDFAVIGTFENGLYGSDLFLRKVGRQDGHTYFVHDYVPVNTTNNEPYALAVDSEGNSYVAGRIMQRSIPGESALPHFAVIKYDPDGKEVWRQVTAPDNKFGIAVAIAVTNSGEVAVTGVNSYENRSMHTMKLAADGTILWEKAYLTTIEDEEVAGLKVHFDNEGNVYTVGCHFETSQFYEIIAIKYKSDGTLLWTNAFGSDAFYHAFVSWNRGQGWEPISGIIDNKLFLIYDDMYHRNSQSFSRIVFQRLDENGASAVTSEIVNFTPELFNSSYWNIASANTMEDGSINLLMRGVVAGYGAEEPLAGNLHMFLRLDENGTILKQKIFKHENEFASQKNAAYVTAENGNAYALILGKDEFIFQKVNADMEEVWRTTMPAQYASDYFNDDQPAFAFVRENGNPVFVTTSLSGNRSNYYFLELDSSTGAELYSAEYDGGFDIAATGFHIPYSDKVFNAQWIKGTDSFVVTGRIIDKAISATTIATLKYGFQQYNIAPELLSFLPDQSVSRGIDYVYTIPENVFADPEGDNLSYNVTLEGGASLPSWLSFDSQTSTLSGTPPLSAVGTINIEVTATDPHGLAVTDVYMLEITSEITEAETDQAEISIYPNPGAVSFFVDNTHGFVRMQIISVDGKSMSSRPLGPGLNEIELDGLARGLYRLQFTTRAGKRLGKNWVKN